MRQETRQRVMIDVMAVLLGSLAKRSGVPDAVIERWLDAASTPNFSGPDFVEASRALLVAIEQP